MKACIVKKDNHLFLLFNTGMSKKIDRLEARHFLDNYYKEDMYPKEEDSLFTETSFKNLKGEILVTVDDDFSLIFHTPELYKSSEAVELEKYLTVKEYAEKHDKSPYMIQKLCQANRIPGLIKLKQSTQYLIPEEAPYPQDPRKKQNK